MPNMKRGKYIVSSPEGSEVLGVFSYIDETDRRDAEQRAKACRQYWKTSGKRARVGIRHIKESL